MYERHFGLSGPPFRLSPDPSFYFDGGQHHAALATLRQAFSSELPVVVLSGEIGAGKTTVLRAWRDECKSAGIAFAKIANTQLDVDALHYAIAAAFGLDASVPDVLRSFFRDLNGGRAALVIDEAQNLDRAALQSLVQLAQMAAAEKAALRVVLAGQPELRGHVAGAALQAWVQQACHLGPLDAGQTRQYIEHRLRKVGWAGVPSFDAQAFEEIHAATGGIPRRVNVLANRLLLGEFLNRTARIDGQAVGAMAQALDAEIGSGTVLLESPRDNGKAAAPAAAAPGSVLVLASGRSDYVKAMALMRAADRQPGLPPTVAVGLSDSTPWQLNLDHRLYLGWGQRLVPLARSAEPPAPQAVQDAFERLLGQSRPAAVLVFDGDATSLACARLAAAQGIALIHVGADAQTVDERGDAESPRAAIGRLAGLRFGCQSPAAAGGAEPPSHAVGNLLVDALCLAWEVAKWNAAAIGRPVASGKHVDERRGYGVVALKRPPAHTGEPVRRGVLALLREVSRDLPLVWPMRHDTMLLAHRSGLARTLDGDRIARIEELGYVNYVRLLRGATCVLTDSADVVEEAAALDVPCLSLGLRHVSHVAAGGWLPAIEIAGNDAKAATRAVWQILFRGTGEAAPPDDWDGQAGARIAARIAQWLGPAAAASPRPPVLHHALRGGDARRGT